MAVFFRFFLALAVSSWFFNSISKSACLSKSGTTVIFLQPASDQYFIVCSSIVAQKFVEVLNYLLCFIPVLQLSLSPLVWFTDNDSDSGYSLVSPPTFFPMLSIILWWFITKQLVALSWKISAFRSFFQRKFQNLFCCWTCYIPIRKRNQFFWKFIIKYLHFISLKL
jgi:hypothetical protein